MAHRPRRPQGPFGEHAPSAGHASRLRVRFRRPSGRGRGRLWGDGHAGCRVDFRHGGGRGIRRPRPGAAGSGAGAFDAGDYQGAIETWSRIYLVDAHHAEAELRIEQARRRREEVERLAEHRFYEAREAFEQGHPDEARALCQEVLSIQPQHLEAHDLLQRLETPAAPPPTPMPSMAADEEDLFRDDFVPATIASTQLATTSSATLGAARERAVAARAAEQGARKIAGLPMLWVAAGGGVLVLVLAGALFMGGKLFSQGSDSVSTSLSIADGLAEKGQLADAIRVLENLSGQLEGEQANLVNERIQSLKKRLKAQATPVPSFDTKAIRATMAGGQRLKAWQMVQDGLAKVPSEPELLAIQGELTSYSMAFPSLAAALPREQLGEAEAARRSHAPGSPRGRRAGQGVGGRDLQPGGDLAPQVPGCARQLASG